MNASDQKIIDLAMEIIEKQLRKKPRVSITSSDMVKKYLRLKIERLEHEVFLVLFLDTQNRLIECRTMFHGTLDSAMVYPREVAKAALQLNAAAIICAHNHPSGVAQESQADRRITTRLIDALGLFDIRVLDHIIVAQGEVLSFADKGYL